LSSDTNNDLIVAAIQMVSGRQREDNLTTAAELIEEAVELGAQLIVLPETFAVFGGGSQREQGEKEFTSEGPIRQFLAQQAKQHGAWLVGGTLPTTESNASGEAPEVGKVYSSTYVLDADGNEVGRYDKAHLFDVDVADGQGQYRESDQFSPGQQPLVVQTPWGKLGVGVCYDLRFPEYFRHLRDLGAEVLAVPAAFTYQTGQAHWEVLLRARAIENQCYIIGANQGGEHSSKRKTWGDSCIISPWGEKLAAQAQGEGVVTAKLDREQLHRIRHDMPVHSHKRF
jgi:deaminated glutathione amidase